MLGVVAGTPRAPQCGPRTLRGAWRRGCDEAGRFRKIWSQALRPPHSNRLAWLGMIILPAFDDDDDDEDKDKDKEDIEMVERPPALSLACLHD